MFQELITIPLIMFHQMNQIQFFNFARFLIPIHFQEFQSKQIPTI